MLVAGLEGPNNSRKPRGWKHHKQVQIQIQTEMLHFAAISVPVSCPLLSTRSSQYFWMLHSPAPLDWSPAELKCHSQSKYHKFLHPIEWSWLHIQIYNLKVVIEFLTCIRCSFHDSHAQENAFKLRFQCLKLGCKQWVALTVVEMYALNSFSGFAIH